MKSKCGKLFDANVAPRYRTVILNFYWRWESDWENFTANGDKPAWRLITNELTTSIY